MTGLPPHASKRLKPTRRQLVWACLSAALAAAACSPTEALDEKRFVGQWQSSRATYPIYLHENGEWEIRSGAGSVLQYGVWRYQKNHIVWTYRFEGQVLHEPNAVISVTENEFRLREQDRSATVFTRVD